MSNLTITESNPTMSSREIADLVESRHDSVKRAVERLAEKGVITSPPLVDIYHDAYNREQKQYLLQKRDSYVVVAQLSPEFTARLVDRWQELEAKQPPVLDLNDPSQLRGLLGTYAERTEIAEAKVEEFEPKAIAFDRLDTAEGNLTPRPASKVLGYPERKLTKWLEMNRWGFRSGGKGPLQAHVDKRNRGYLDHKLHRYEDAKTGEYKTSIQLVITPKGLARLAKILPNNGEAA